MNSSSTEFHKIWIEQCEAAEDIRQQYGLDSALAYLIGEKLFTFVEAAERDAEFAAELPAFVAAIQRLFSGAEIREHLKHLERTKYLAPQESDLGIDDQDGEHEAESWLENPVLGAAELLRFSRIHQLLLP